MITAAETCDFINNVVCKPENVNSLFEFGNFGSSDISRTEILILLAAIIPVVLMFFGLRKKSVVPGRLQSVVESIFTFVKDEIALGVIGRGGEKFTPYLISVFMFILVGNLFEVTPLINFPVTSRMALPLFLSLVTYVIFLFVGIKSFVSIHAISKILSPSLGDKPVVSVSKKNTLHQSLPPSEIA